VGWGPRWPLPLFCQREAITKYSLLSLASLLLCCPLCCFLNDLNVPVVWLRKRRPAWVRAGAREPAGTFAWHRR